MELLEREIKKFKKGEIIFREGDAADCMYDIHWGSVGIYANYGTDKEKLLRKLGSEEFFGEMGLIESMPRSATAVVLEKETKIEIITKDTFADYLNKKPARVYMVMQQMSGQIRDLTQSYLNACRVLSEAVASEENGAEKSEWFKKNADKMIADYENAAK